MLLIYILRQFELMFLIFFDFSGETYTNYLYEMQGQSLATLTNEGIENVKEIGLKFQDIKFEYIYSSDCLRAEQFFFLTFIVF
jgi:hypothetical protein